MFEERCLAVSRSRGFEAGGVRLLSRHRSAAEARAKSVKAVEHAGMADAIREQAELAAIDAGSNIVKLDRVK